MEEICWHCCGAKKIITGRNDNTMLGLYVECPWCVTFPLAEEKKKQEKIESLKCEHCKGSGENNQSYTVHDLIMNVNGPCGYCGGHGHKLKETLDYLLEKAK